MATRLPLLLAIGLAVTACGEAPPKSLFLAKATPELRAALTRLCLDPTGPIKGPGGDERGRVYSLGRCQLSLRYDPVTLRIKDLRLSTDSARFDLALRRRFVEEVALPLLAPDVQRYVRRHVLADFGIEKSEVEINRRGSVLYDNHAVDPPMAGRDVAFAFEVTASNDGMAEP